MIRLLLNPRYYDAPRTKSLPLLRLRGGSARGLQSLQVRCRRLVARSHPPL